MKLLVLESIFNVFGYNKADIVFAGESVEWDGKIETNSDRSKVTITVTDGNGIKYTAPVEQFEVLEDTQSRTVVNVSGSIDPEKVAEQLADRVTGIRLSNPTDEKTYKLTGERRGVTIGTASVEVVAKETGKKLAKHLNIGDMIKFGSGQKEPYKVTGLQVGWADTVTISYVDHNGHGANTVKDFDSEITLGK